MVRLGATIATLAILADIGHKWCCPTHWAAISLRGRAQARDCARRQVYGVCRRAEAELRAHQLEPIQVELELDVADRGRATAKGEQTAAVVAEKQN